jgi:signal peptidase II
MPKWLTLAALVVVADQISKFAVTRTFALYEVMEVTPFFNLVLVYNRGAAFSFLAGAGGWQREFFIAIAVIACVWIVWLLRRYRQETLFCLSLALILGGALGNLVDRVLIGAVVDFLDFHAFGYHWPAFNVADAAITCGAVLLVWDSFRGSDRSASKAAG